MFARSAAPALPGTVSCCLLLTVLAGCGQSPTEVDPLETGSLWGPWAAEMEQASQTFPSLFSNGVFTDGKITEQEFLEARQIVLDCFSAEGLEASWDAYGYLSVGGAGLSGDAPPEAMGECTFADGGVMEIYHRMMVNPENEDDMELRARCLVSVGVVEPGFTGAELDSAYQTETLPWAQGDDAARQCLLDPLGLVEPDSLR